MGACRTCGEKAGALKSECDNCKAQREAQERAQRAAQQAIDEGHLRAGTDPKQLVFEMYGLVLALHHDARFIRSPGAVGRAHAGFQRLIAGAEGHGLGGDLLMPPPEPID